MLKTSGNENRLPNMDYMPLSGREQPRFAAIKTFFRLPHVPVTADYDVAMFGIPYDGGVSYRPGPRFAPTRVREASALGRGFHWGRDYHVFKKMKVADVGDCPVVPIDQGQTYQRIEKFVGELCKLNKRFISVGGDHSTTLPVLRALRQHYGEPLAFIHFDAHLDTYPAAWGCEYHHGAFARHAVEEGLVDPKLMVQIGLRGPLADGDDLDFVRSKGVKLVTVDDVRNHGLSHVVGWLPQFHGRPTYISYDVDCLDPAFAPGTGTPVVGGLTTYETQRILRALKIERLVGADVVEYSPPYDHADITALACVDAAFELLCLMSESKSKS